MNALDWVCLGIIVLLAVRCLVRGFVAEILSVAAYVVGLAVALLLYKQGGALIHGKWAQVPLPEAIAFAVLFVVAFLLTRLLGNMLREGLEAANLATLDRVLGFVLGAFEGLLAVSVLLIILQVVGNIVDTSKLLASSVFAKAILPIVGPELAKALGGGTTLTPIPNPMKGPVPVKKP
jgi:membrane protein required for colicin V production